MTFEYPHYTPDPYQNKFWMEFNSTKFWKEIYEITMDTINDIKSECNTKTKNGYLFVIDYITRLIDQLQKYPSLHFSRDPINDYMASLECILHKLKNIVRSQMILYKNLNTKIQICLNTLTIQINNILKCELQGGDSYVGK